MNRRESFEAYWADQNDVPPESMEQYRCDDERQYRTPMMARNYRIWCAALDAADTYNRRALLVHIDQSENVTPILPLADRTEIVLPNEKFDSLTRALEDNKLADNKRLQDLLNGKGRWS